MVALDAVVDEVDLRLIELNVQTADLVDQRGEAVKADGDILVDIKAEVAVDGLDQLACAAAAVAAAIGAVELVVEGEPPAFPDAVHARVTHERNEGDFAGVRIQRGKNHGVRATFGVFRFVGAARVGADEESIDHALVKRLFLIDGHWRGRRCGVVRYYFYGLRFFRRRR
ncbi:hypothetical protein SDC9_96108 [bioreactor metagenome]|uniref:Uncharacterized protein n=1 Tax=bioreactor metagenome TaxID=1076179 RepID=A0A645A874_9ZZZZ